METDSMTVHVSDMVSCLLDDWRRNGCGGVRFSELVLEGPCLDDFLADGKSEQEFQEFRRDYACFQAIPSYREAERAMVLSTKDSDYSAVGKVRKDARNAILRELNARLGPEYTIECWPMIDEYEIQRRPLA